MNFKYSIIILYFYFVQIVLGFDPFSIGSVVVGAGSYFYSLTSNAVSNVKCKIKECCTPEEIPAKYEYLNLFLKDNLYGQHLVRDVVVNSIKAHWSSLSNKPLTLSFHGGPGIGKNYVVSFIVKQLYNRGFNSDHVHTFNGRIHFPLESKTSEYQVSLYNWVKGNVTNCPRQMFIFDEVDKMPPKVLNCLKPVIDYHEKVDGVDYRQAIFIFLSNTGGTLIADKYLQLWQLGVQREDLELHNFENLILQGAFNEEGGFQYSDTIKSNLIDHYVPFLPLEEEHVRKCVIDEFRKRNVPNAPENLIREALEGVEWGPEPHKLFSKTGCKRISQKVALLVQKHAPARYT